MVPQMISDWGRLRQPCIRGQHPQVVARRAPGEERPGIEVRSHDLAGVGVLAQRLPVEQRLSLAVVEAEHEPHRRGLTRPVRAKEPGHHSIGHVERQIVHRAGGTK